jgi:hypothetical protein
MCKRFTVGISSALAFAPRRISNLFTYTHCAYKNTAFGELLVVQFKLLKSYEPRRCSTLSPLDLLN